MTTFATLFSSPANSTSSTIDTDSNGMPATLLPADELPLAPVNLHAVGYEKAEQHRGNAQALDNLLNRVLRGYLVDERNDDSRRQQHEQRVGAQLLELEKQAETARTDIRKINGTQLPALRDAIEQLNEEILQIRRDEAAGLRDPNHLDRVKLRLYGGLVGFLTLFMFLFYVSAFYSAFYRDLAGELQTAGPDRQAGVLSAIFAKAAFSVIDFHWCGPMLLFAFGGLLHVLVDYKTLIGRLLLVALLGAIAGTDGLIAYFVEAKNHEVKVLMGLAEAGDHAWWASPVFWLVIALGFVAALVWSALLHAWMQEVSKKDVGRITALDIQHRQEKQWTLKGQINELTASLADLEGQLARIELEVKSLQARRQSVVFSPSELEKYVTDFYDGWLTYVNNRMGNDAPLRDACDAVIKSFYARHLSSEPAAEQLPVHSLFS
ncbi:hypothetical protein [Fibrella arboris]|uniref:hypothetical protein n=1 Tax=Fibrella arboris TaxID=3242486 RepID=UPI003521117B